MFSFVFALLSSYTAPVSPPAIRIRKQILEAMMAHAGADQTKECCGLLAGKNQTITKIFSAQNIAPSPATSYEIAPPELFRFMREMRDTQRDFLGIYHSHPTTDNAPSPTDVARAYYPDVAYFILSPLATAPNPVRAFRIRDAHASEVSIEIIDQI